MLFIGKQVEKISKFAEARGKYEAASGIYRALRMNINESRTPLAMDMDELGRQLMGEADALSAEARGL